MQRIIHWFRQDLRLSDNPALTHAIKLGEILPIFILDKNFSIGEASAVWLHYSLVSLNCSLDNKLQFFVGNSQDILIMLAKKYNITAITWNRCYEKPRIDCDKKIQQALEACNIQVKIFNSLLLWEPWQITKQDGGQYKVFTPYRRACISAVYPRSPIPKPSNIYCINAQNNTDIASLALLPNNNWYKPVIANWSIGEDSALQKLEYFINNNINNYKIGRDYPNSLSTSRLSPHLHFGEISPNTILHVIKNLAFNDSVDSFISELIWREFAYYLLYYFHTLDQQNWNSKFDRFEWQFNEDNLIDWQTGQTGIPIIDAGMRELWQTGYMHNRVRMITASFLTKNLLIDWRYGARWFWNALFDADLASNSASWQWVAGCGADAAPYFRIFNPVTQSEKFDTNGEYIRKYLPELSNLPNRYLHKPWLANQNILNSAKIILGIDYPLPIINLEDSRKRALKQFKALSCDG